MKEKIFHKDLSVSLQTSESVEKVDFMKFVMERSKVKPVMRNKVDIDNFRLYEYVASEEADDCNDFFFIHTRGIRG